MSDLLFKIMGVIYILIVIMTYIPKKKKNTLNYYLFHSLIAGSTLVLVLDLLSVYLGIYLKGSIISPIASKIYLCFLIIWMITFVLYIKVITSPNNLENLTVKEKSHGSIMLKMVLKAVIAVLIAAVGISVIPLVLTTDGESLFMSGPCMIFFNICYVICILTWISFIIRYRKSYSKDKLPAMIASTFFAIISMIVQFARPEHPVMSFAFSLITMITYHGIHNPDLKVIEELNEATMQANAANKAKSDFISSMSHEIRTPLNAIVGFSQALGKKEITGPAKDEVQEILNASNSLLETINGILDISKLEANKIELLKKDYSTKSLFNEIKTLSNNRLGNKNIELKYEIDENLPPVLLGDRERIKQVIMNLMSNAIKYTKEGSVLLKVEALTNKEKCQLSIVVEDTGVGMSEQDIELVFVKFQRFDIDKYRSIEGTGLGMAITKGLIELMQGEISVTSELQKGTKFTVKLDQEISTKDISEIADISSLAINPFDASGQRVLVVDDNRVNLKVAEHFLEQYKLDLDFCTSGRDCIDKILKGEKYDLILLDIMMPRMKGTEVIKELLNIPGFNIPVVALTADVLSDLGGSYTNYGFNDVIAKPIVEEDLYNTLKKYLRENTNKQGIPNTVVEPQIELPTPAVVEEKEPINFDDLPDVNYLSEIKDLSSSSVFPDEHRQEPEQKIETDKE